MKLKEKLKTTVTINTDGEASRFANQCEQIADEYAIEFANWINEHYWSDYKSDVYYKSISNFLRGIFYNSKELLEIFKKEKGL